MFLSRDKFKFLAIAYLIASVSVMYFLARMPKSYETSSIISILPAQQPLSKDGDLNRQPPALSVEQAARSQIALLESEEVIRHAIDKIGLNRLVSDPNAQVPSHVSAWFNRLRKRAENSEVGVLDLAYMQVADAEDARFEPNTNLIRLRLRDGDPILARDLASAIVDSFVNRYYELYSGGGAVEFFQDQQMRSAKNYADLSTKLAEFSRVNNIFDVAEQRRLLLQERTRIAGALLATQGQIGQAAEQARVIPEQLAKMKPVGRLPQVTGLTQKQEPDAEPRTKAQNEEDSTLTRRLAQDPPILLVKVYQDTIANLVKLKIDLEGYRALEKQQQLQLKNIDTQLGILSAKEAEFDRLHLEVMQAKQGTEAYSRRTLEERLALELNSNMLSGVRVVQRATTPLKPVWPTTRLVLAFGLVMCLLPALFFTGRYLTRGTWTPTEQPRQPATAPAVRPLSIQRSARPNPRVSAAVGT
jgi:polysaccharide biosynthesis transport protein